MIPSATSPAATPSPPAPSYTAFAGTQRLVAGELRAVARKVKQTVDGGGKKLVLIFDDATGAVIDVDLRGTLKNVLDSVAHLPRPSSTPTAAAESAEARGPGRPKLGVIAREVTLLPRHWDWLGSQPGGASVAIRKLVEEARRTHGGRDRKRRAQESAYRFMHALAGNEHGFEEAARALFAGDAEKFELQTKPWPRDVREYARGLAVGAFGK